MNPAIAPAALAHPAFPVLPGSHAPDEHISLENYFSGIKAIAHFYSALASI